MALTSLTSVKAHLGISGTSEDALLTQLIGQVDALIKKWCRRAIESATFTEYPRGRNSSVIRLKETPISSITSVHVDYNRTFDATTLLDTDLYRVINDDLVRIGSVWPGTVERTRGLLSAQIAASRGIIKVVYVGGYTTLPADLELAANQTIARIRAGKGYGQTVQSESFENYSYSLTGLKTDDLLAPVMQLLVPYRRLTP